MKIKILGVLVGAIITAGALLAVLCVGVYFLLGYRIAMGLWFILMFTNILAVLRGINSKKIKL